MTVPDPTNPPAVCSKCGTAGCLEDAQSGWYDDLATGVDLEEHFIDANEHMGEALTAIGMALGLPRPEAGNTWGAPEILARIAEHDQRDNDRRYAMADGYENELAQMRATHTAAVAAHEAWLARVTTERDAARAELAGYDPDGLKHLMNEAAQLRRQRAAALALADQWAASGEMLWPSESRRLLYRELGVTPDA